MEAVKQFENFAIQLWQGKGIDIEDAANAINYFVDDVISSIEKMGNMGVVFPMEYVTNALKEFHESIEKKDDYAMADCLYFSWREIAIVYTEIMTEIGE